MLLVFPLDSWSLALCTPQMWPGRSVSWSLKSKLPVCTPVCQLTHAYGHVLVLCELNQFHNWFQFDKPTHEADRMWPHCVIGQPFSLTSAVRAFVDESLQSTHRAVSCTKKDGDCSGCHTLPSLLISSRTSSPPPAHEASDSSCTVITVYIYFA